MLFLAGASPHLPKGSVSKAQRWGPAWCESNSKRCGTARQGVGVGAAWRGGLGAGSQRVLGTAGGRWYPALSGKAGKDFKPEVNMVTGAL